MTTGCSVPARAIAIAAAIAAGAGTACSGTGGSPRPPSADVGYVDWSVGLVWRLDDLPAVFAAFDRLCDRADSGDESARAEVAAAGPDLWLIRERLLPLLRSLPDASGVPDEAAVAGRCRPEPDPALADAVAALGNDPAAWPGSAGPILEIEASHEGGRGLADEARLARVVVAVGPLASGPPGPSPALAASIALLECPPCPAPRDPADLWASLAVEALSAEEGSDVVDVGSLGPAARDAASRQGLLRAVLRALLPVAEDAGSNLRTLALELLDRLALAWTGAALPRATGD